MDKDPCFSCVTCNFLTYDPDRLKTHISVIHPGKTAEFLRQIISKLMSDKVRRADALFHSLLESSTKEEDSPCEDKDLSCEGSWSDSKDMEDERHEMSSKPEERVEHWVKSNNSDMERDCGESDSTLESNSKGLSQENDIGDELSSEDLFPVRIVCNVSNRLATRSENDNNIEFCTEENRSRTNISLASESELPGHVDDDSKSKDTANSDVESFNSYADSTNLDADSVASITGSPSLPESPCTIDMNIHEGTDASVHNNVTLCEDKEVKEETGLSESLLATLPLMNDKPPILSKLVENDQSEKSHLETTTSDENGRLKDTFKKGGGKYINQVHLKIFADGTNPPGSNEDGIEQIYSLTKSLLPKVVVKKLNDSFLVTGQPGSKVNGHMPLGGAIIKNNRPFLQRDDALTRQRRTRSTNDALDTYLTRKRRMLEVDVKSDGVNQQLGEAETIKSFNKAKHFDGHELSDGYNNRSESSDESLDDFIAGDSDYRVESDDEDSEEYETKKKFDLKKKSKIFVKRSGPYFCTVCNRKFAHNLSVKNHCIQKHFNTLLAFDKGNNQTLHFCPKDCNFSTSKPAALSRHVVACRKPELQCYNGHNFKETKELVQESSVTDLTPTVPENRVQDTRKKSQHQVMIKICHNDGLVITREGDRQRIPIMKLKIKRNAFH